jgi:hypothetical protein
VTFCCSLGEDSQNSLAWRFKPANILLEEIPIGKKMRQTKNQNKDWEK